MLILATQCADDDCFTEGVRIFKDNQESKEVDSQVYYSRSNIPETVEVTLGSKEVRH